MKKFFAVSSLLLSILQADVLFHERDVSLGVALGSGSVDYGTKTEDYFIVGAGVDYFVMDNLSLGVSLLGWVGGSPSIVQYTLPLNYYLDTGSALSPYGGIYYRYTNYSGSYSDRFGNSYEVDSTHSLGVRLGVAYRVGFGFVGVGVASQRSDAGESSTYPEISVGFVF